MSSPPHPLASSDRVIRLREHTLVDVSDLLDADTFALVDQDVTFTRRRAGQPVQRWHARIGDWCVPDDGEGWRLVADAESTTVAPAPEAADISAPDRIGTPAPAP